jgi:hypothetical protein
MTLLKEFYKAVKLVHSLLKLRVVKLLLGIGFVVLVLPWVWFFSAKPTPAENITLGINFSSKYATQLGLNWQKAYLKILDELKPTTLRLIVYWEDVEPTRGEYDFSEIKWQLEEAEQRNIQVILAIGRKVPRYPECFEPEWWHNLGEWQQKEDALLGYISKAVTELKDYKNIEMWQVENEPHFPFGICETVPPGLLEKEIAVTRSLDSRPIITQDSGESGVWLTSFKSGNYLGISMYRKVWADILALITGGKFPYFKYPLGSWAYDIKADILGISTDKIIVTELQAEPWGPEFITELSEKEKRKTMSKQDFIATLNYAQTSGFDTFYFWGAEWWLWEMEHNQEPFYWDTAKTMIKGLTPLPANKRR